MTASQARKIADDMLKVGHFVLDRVSWDFYSYILERRDEAGAWARITYDRGMMEIRTGGDVEGLMRDGLARMLERFSCSDDFSIRLVDKRRYRNADEIYALAISTTSEDGSDFSGSEPGERVVELTVTRAVLEKSESDPERFVPGTPQLRLKGRIQAHVEGGRLTASPESALYPGIDVADHFGFIWLDRKEAKK